MLECNSSVELNSDWKQYQALHGLTFLSFRSCVHLVLQYALYFFLLVSELSVYMLVVV